MKKWKTQLIFQETTVALCMEEQQIFYYKTAVQHSDKETRWGTLTDKLFREKYRSGPAILLIVRMACYHEFDGLSIEDFRSDQRPTETTEVLVLRLSGSVICLYHQNPR